MVDVFISYAAPDESYVSQLYDSLKRLQNIEPIVAEWISAPGMNLVEKVKEGLKQSKCVVALITSNSHKEIWPNQEIGFATAKNQLIIPIKEEAVSMRGFLEGIEYIKFDPDNFLYNVSDVIDRLVLEYGIRNFFAVCPKCKNKNLRSLSDRDATRQDELSITYSCDECDVPFTVHSVNLIEDVEYGMA